MLFKKGGVTCTVLCCLLWLAGCGGGSSNQPGATNNATLFGAVTDADSSLPLSEVSIELGNKLVQTDAAGQYQFEHLVAGSFSFTIEHSGYHPFSNTITLVPGENKPFSVALTKTTNAIEPPAQPVVGTSADADRITISWPSALHSSGYNLYWMAGEAFELSLATKVANVSSPQILEVPSSGSYSLVVSAFNRAGETYSESVVQHVTVSPPLLAAPQPLLQNNALQVQVSWQPVVAATEYDLYWAGARFSSVDDATKVGAVSSPYFHQDLQPGATYYYALIAKNGETHSQLSQVEAIEIPLAQLTAVQQPQVVQIAETISLSWQPVEGATQYDLLIAHHPDDFEAGAATLMADMGLEHTFSDLLPGTYYFAVIARAEHSEQDAPRSELASATLLAPIAAPENVAAVVKNSTIAISWDEVAGAQHYSLYWANHPNVSLLDNHIEQVSSPYLHQALTEGSYYYRLVAHDATTQSALSMEVDGMIQQRPVASDTHVQISSHNQMVSLSWEPVSGATGYLVYAADEPFDSVAGSAVKLEQFDVNTHQFEHTIVMGSTIKYYRIATAENPDPSAWSELVAVNIGDTHNQYLWKPSDDKDYDYKVDVTQHSEGREFAFETTQPLREQDGEMPASERTVNEANSGLHTRTGHQLFDGLFALAMDEVAQNSVSHITDKNFDGAPCDCFETGRLWNYVWTRDTAYSVDLALGQLDPQRSVRSLIFKLSTGRSDNQLEIVQDTGTGGSWPVSTDRVTWAMGAWQALHYLTEPERGVFRDKMITALTNTIRRDREAIFDPRDGLYYGEQSFLDWRRQTYPDWTANDLSPIGNGTVHIGMSKALSTNIAHYQILTIAAALAEETGAQMPFASWAAALKTAINKELWLPEQGLYSTMKTTEFDAAKTHKYDALGEALAIISGIASPEQAASIMANYPHTQAGVPVIWPQQPNTVVYHNRGIWPFVSAYMIKAARAANNDAVVNHNIDSIMRGAGFNLSNMENYEFFTQQSNFIENGNSYPVVNSQRQLWSVAGYISMVQNVIFGQQASATGIRFSPYITAYLRNKLFDNQNYIELNNIQYQGALINVTVQLPLLDQKTAGVYRIIQTQLNGEPLAEGGEISLAMLSTTKPNNVVIRLGELEATQHQIAMVTTDVDNTALFEHSDDAEKFWAPKEPILEYPTLEGDKIKLSFNSNNEAQTQFNIYRNGKVVAKALPANTSSWIDPNSSDYSDNIYCYAVEQYYGSGNHSHHSEPQCYWHNNDAVVQLDAGSGLVSLDGATESDLHGVHHFNDWGLPAQRLEAEFSATVSGDYYLQTVYGNHYNEINTGITATVKTFTVTANDNSEPEQRGIVFMPQLDSWEVWGDSSLVPFTFTAGKSYTIRVSDYFNMSDLQHFDAYHKAGGNEGRVNKANIAALKVLRMTTK